MITTDMISSYEGLENNEMVAELGIKTIKDIEKERNYTKMLQKSTLFLCSYLKLYSRVAKALMKLKRLDEGNHYIGECIEVHFLALSYNPQPETFEKINKVPTQFLVRREQICASFQRPGTMSDRKQMLHGGLEIFQKIQNS